MRWTVNHYVSLVNLKNTKIGDKLQKRNIDEKRWRWSKWIALVFKIHKPGFFKICIYVYIYIRKIYIKYKNISKNI